MAGYEIERIVAIKNSVTRYGVMHRFRESLSKGLEEAGVEMGLMDWGAQNSAEVRRQFYASPPDCTFAFNGPPRLPNGKVFAEEVEVPHVAWLIDSAHHFREFAEFGLHVLITPDQTSADLLHAWGAKSVHFLPHGADPLPEGLPFEERPYSLAFFGSLYDPDPIVLGWKKSYPDSLTSFLLEAAEKVLSIPELCYQAVLREHPHFNDPESLPLVLEFDLYIRSLERVRLLRSLQGLPLHIFGEADREVRQLIGNADGFEVHPPLSFEETLKEMGRTQIVLNSSPMFKTGGHERVFYAQSAGACVLTPDAPWMRSHFVPEEEILMYRGKEALLPMLKDRKALAEIARRGREKTLKENTWSVRAKELLAILSKELPACFP